MNVQAVRCVIEDFLQYLFPMTARGKLSQQETVFVSQDASQLCQLL